MNAEDLLTMLLYFKASIYFLVMVSIIHGGFEVYSKKRKASQTLCNLGIYGVYVFLRNFFATSVIFLGLSFVYKFRLLQLSISWYNILIWVILADFIYYWKHRVEHKVRILWAFHSVHHSSSEFNLSTALRLPWLTPFYSWLFYCPMCLLGAPPLGVIFAITAVLGYQFLIHNQAVGKNRFLDKILNSPSSHRVHHGSNKKYLDKNFGGILMLWDHIFQTYASEEESPQYGTSKQVHSNNPVVVNFIEVARVWQETKKAPTFFSKLKVVFGKP